MYNWRVKGKLQQGNKRNLDCPAQGSHMKKPKRFVFLFLVLPIRKNQNELHWLPCLGVVQKLSTG